MPKIIDNAISLYEKDSSFYHIMLNAVKKPKLFGLPEVQRQVLRFFNETGTRDKAVIELWKAKNDRSRNAYMIALLVTIENIYVFKIICLILSSWIG